MGRKSADTDIATVALQCMKTFVFMTWCNEAGLWPRGKAEHAVLAQG